MASESPICTELRQEAIYLIPSSLLLPTEICEVDEVFWRADWRTGTEWWEQTGSSIAEMAKVGIIIFAAKANGLHAT